MQITFDANKKKLDTNPVFGLLVQGENLAESIRITGPKMVGALDLSKLRVAVRMSSEAYETTVEKTLEQTTDGDTITFTWEVDKQFTGSPGKVDVMLVGYGGNEEVIKITSAGMVVQEDKVFGTAPPESTWNQILQQMQDFATQAYESKTEAANSAAAAAESQKVAEEKAAQATNAAADAAAQAAAKTERQIRQYADDRYARPLVTKTGPAASLEVYPDKLSNLKVYANGFTSQAEVDSTNQTNVKAIKSGGIRMYKLELDGTKGNQGSRTSDTVFDLSIGITVPAINGYTNPTAVFSKFNNVYNSSNAWDAFIWAGGTGLDLLIPKTIAPNLNSAKQWLADLYAAGDPVTVWYQPASESDATGLYAPIILQGSEYRATCIEVTNNLCKMDSVVNWTTSGCDKTQTFDGSEDENWKPFSGVPGAFYIDVTPAIVNVDAEIYTNKLYKSGEALSASPIGSFKVQSTGTALRLIVVYDKSSTDPSAIKADLSAHPLVIWYRSAEYTEDNDIPVSLEIHADTQTTYAHPAVFLPAMPDDSGKVTITGQSGGTVTVMFNKSIVKAFAELQSAVLAMGANLSI